MYDMIELQEVVRHVVNYYFIYFLSSFLIYRYEVCICSGNKVETVESGLLEQLLLHSPEVKNLYSKRLDATFKIQVPDSPSGAEWFTKSILTRFLSCCVSLSLWMLWILLSYKSIYFLSGFYTLSVHQIYLTSQRILKMRFLN